MAAGMNKVELEIIALSHSITQTHSYAVVLGEVNGLRRLPVIIGGFEAQAIAVALERMKPNRPLSHDLMKNLMLAFDIDLKEVLINDLQEGIFYSRLICESEKGIIEIDSRTSDALALAVRFGCPIYTYESILENGKIVTDEEEDDPEKKVTIQHDEPEGDQLDQMSIDELQNLLSEVLEKEDYIKAAAIRDEINRRKGK